MWTPLASSFFADSALTELAKNFVTESSDVIDEPRSMNHAMAVCAKHREVLHRVVSNLEPFDLRERCEVMRFDIVLPAFAIPIFEIQ